MFASRTLMLTITSTVYLTGNYIGEPSSRSSLALS